MTLSDIEILSVNTAIQKNFAQFERLIEEGKRFAEVFDAITASASSFVSCHEAINRLSKENDALVASLGAM